jgi:hypothetical protein
MTTALNLTLPIKQDAATLQKLAYIKQNFSASIQPMIDAALRKSEIVHYARVLVIDDKYIQVITEYDGPKEVYAEFFRRELPDVFKAVFSLADGVPGWDELNQEDTFYKISTSRNVKSLGESTTGDPKEGYLFAAYPEIQVKQILEKFPQ